MLYLHTTHPAVVHCDLKPDNIMFDSRHVVRIIDFGLALTKESSRMTSMITARGTVLPPLL